MLHLLKKLLQVAQNVPNVKVAQSCFIFYNKNCIITANYSTLFTVTTNNNLWSTSTLKLQKEYNATISNKNQDKLSDSVSPAKGALVTCLLYLSMTGTSTVSSIQHCPLFFLCVDSLPNKDAMKYDTHAKQQIVARAK